MSSQYQVSCGLSMEESSISSNGPIHGYGNYMEDYQMGEHLWNFLTKEESKETSCNNEEVDVEVGIDAHIFNDFKDIRVWEEIEPENCVYNGFRVNGFVVDKETDDEELVGYGNMSFHIEDSQDMTDEYSHDIEVFDDSYIEVPTGKTTYYSPSLCNTPPNNFDLVEKFAKATRYGDRDDMEKLGRAHPNTLTMEMFRNGGTALHHTLWYGHDRVDIAKCLVELMEPKDLEIRDKEGYTPLALAVLLHHEKDLLECLIEKNEDSLEIGESDKIPIVIASSKGFGDTIEFLYRRSTNKRIFSQNYENVYDAIELDGGGYQDHIRGRVGINLLNKCIGIKLFEIAEELLREFPIFLRRLDDDYIYPIHALVKSMVAIQTLITEQKKSSHYLLSTLMPGDWKSSSGYQESIHTRDQAYELLQVIIDVKDFEINIENTEFIVEAMMEAAKSGNIKFITEMLTVDRELINISKGGKNMFWHAIMNRQVKVFNLIYAFRQKKDMLLSFNLKDKVTSQQKVIDIRETDENKKLLPSLNVEEKEMEDENNGGNLTYYTLQQSCHHLRYLIVSRAQRFKCKEKYNGLRLAQQS